MKAKTAKFGKSEQGLSYDLDLKESAGRLHELSAELDPPIFIAYLTLGRTWNALSKLGDKYSANLGLTAYQRHALRFLLVAPDQRLTHSELASRLETSMANTTKLVSRMERAGMVQREVDDVDRRLVWVVVTPLGGERYLAALPISEVDRQAFSVLSIGEQELLTDLLTRVQEKVLELLNPPGNSDPDLTRQPDAVAESLQAKRVVAKRK